MIDNKQGNIPKVVCHTREGVKQRTSADWEGCALEEGMTGARLVRQQAARKRTGALGDLSSGRSCAVTPAESATRRLMSLLPDVSVASASTAASLRGSSSVLMSRSRAPSPPASATASFCSPSSSRCQPLASPNVSYWLVLDSTRLHMAIHMNSSIP